MFYLSGFTRVKVKGKRAKPVEARIFVAAPHSSFMDALPYVLLGAPSVVAKADTFRTPIFGSMIFWVANIACYIKKSDCTYCTLTFS